MRSLEHGPRRPVPDPRLSDPGPEILERRPLGRRRDRIVQELESRQIETRLSFPPVHSQPYYQNRFGYKNDSFPVTYDAWARLIDIPLWAGLGDERQDGVVQALKEIVPKA